MSEVTETPEIVEEVAASPAVIEETAEVVPEEQSSTEVASETNDTDDQQLKRKRDEGDDDEAAAKRASIPQETAVPAAAVSAVPAAAVSSISASGDNETISIAPDKVGQIIGTKVESPLVHLFSSIISYCHETVIITSQKFI